MVSQAIRIFLKLCFSIMRGYKQPKTEQCRLERGEGSKISRICWVDSDRPALGSRQRKNMEPPAQAWCENMACAWKRHANASPRLSASKRAAVPSRPSGRRANAGQPPLRRRAVVVRRRRVPTASAKLKADGDANRIMLLLTAKAAREIVEAFKANTEAWKRLEDKMDGKTEALKDLEDKMDGKTDA